MRQLIRTYTITGNHLITVTGYTFTKLDIRLILNESLASAAVTTEDLVASVLVSSTAKNNIVSVVNGIITLANTTANLTVGDELTIEIDIDNVAKESNATANKNAIINAINNIDLSTVAKESAATANKEAIIAAINSAEPDLSSVAKETSVKSGNDTVIAVTKAIQDAVGSASSGSEITTLFAWLTTIYEYLAGQTPEEIPEGLGDRINLLLQFFGLPQALPEYQSMTEEEIKSINTDVWLGLYGYGVVKNTLHYKNFIDEVVTIDTYFNSGKTYADYGYASLWSAHDVTVDVNSNPIADAEIYTYNPPVE